MAAMRHIIDVLSSSEIRTLLILLLLLIDIILVARVVQLGRQDKRRAASEGSTRKNLEQLWTVLERRAEQEDRMLQLMSELTAHVEVALNRTHLTESSRSLLTEHRTRSELRSSTS